MLASAMTAGVWVSSVQCLLAFESEQILPVPISSDDDFVICTVDVPLSEALQHGVVVSDIDTRTVHDIVYKASERYLLTECTSVGESFPIISGQTYISPAMAEVMVSLHTIAPFSHCTYHAIDSGLQPINISLYLDLLAAVCVKNKEEFVNEKGSNTFLR